MTAIASRWVADAHAVFWRPRRWAPTPCASLWRGCSRTAARCGADADPSAGAGAGAQVLSRTRRIFVSGARIPQDRAQQRSPHLRTGPVAVRCTALVKSPHPHADCHGPTPPHVTVFSPDQGPCTAAFPDTLSDAFHDAFTALPSACSRPAVVRPADFFCRSACRDSVHGDHGGAVLQCHIGCRSPGGEWAWASPCAHGHDGGT